MFVNAAGRYLKRCVTICLWTACAGRGYRLHLQKSVDLGSSIGSALDCCVARSKDFGSLNLRFLPCKTGMEAGVAALESLGQEDPEFKVSQRYLVRPSHKQTKGN